MSKFLDDKGIENASTYDFNALEDMDPSLGKKNPWKKKEKNKFFSKNKKFFIYNIIYL
jgi:hypothetical protein